MGKQVCKWRTWRKFCKIQKNGVQSPICLILRIYALLTRFISHFIMIMIFLLQYCAIYDTQTLFDVESSNFRIISTKANSYP